ncbi:MAG: hypothetical protein KDA37_03295, partial [Planctomycetales bacterium]|nr:hypothetical protein [Planctomycetales bacterium]
MKALSGVFPLLLFALVVGAASQASAEIIGAEDFEGTDYALGGTSADVGGTWSSNGSTSGGAFDTAQFGGAHDGSFVDFTRGIGAGEKLVMTFSTLATAGAMFQANNNYA